MGRQDGEQRRAPPDIGQPAKTRIPRGTGRAGNRMVLAPQRIARRRGFVAGLRVTPF